VSLSPRWPRSWIKYAVTDRSHAELIGDPVSHSLSPLIHRHWLRMLRLPGDYRATRIAESDLPRFLARRRRDADWRGCNVTAPHKVKVIDQLDRLDETAARVGAVNCISRLDGALVGHNLDVDGIRGALEGLPLTGARVVVIGAGGAARAACVHLAAAGAAITLLARRPAGAQTVAMLAPDLISVRPLSEAPLAFEGAALIVNATPAGQTGAAPFPAPLVGAAERAAAGGTVFDMTYGPARSALLAAADAAGLCAIDGLPMLVAQARGSFRLLFGVDSPADEDGSLAAALNRSLGRFA
jgi:shikimate dehydrogenase